MAFRRRAVALNINVADGFSTTDVSSTRRIRTPLSKGLAFSKTVWFVRHGEAEHNTTAEWTMWDPSLTIHGRRQARAARSSLSAARAFDLDEDVRAQLVVSSPLRRSLQTAEIIAEGTVTSVVAHPDLQETSQAACDTGHPCSVLQAEFPAVNFDSVPDSWFDKSKGDNSNTALRLSRFSAWLSTRKEERIICVAHLDSIHGLAGHKLRNGEVMEFTFSQNGWQNIMREEFKTTNLRKRVKVRESLTDNSELGSSGVASAQSTQSDTDEYARHHVDLLSGNIYEQVSTWKKLKSQHAGKNDLVTVTRLDLISHLRSLNVDALSVELLMTSITEELRNLKMTGNGVPIEIFSAVFCQNRFESTRNKVKKCIQEKNELSSKSATENTKIRPLSAFLPSRNRDDIHKNIPRSTGCMDSNLKCRTPIFLPFSLSKSRQVDGEKRYVDADTPISRTADDRRSHMPKGEVPQAHAARLPDASVTIREEGESERSRAVPEMTIMELKTVKSQNAVLKSSMHLMDQESKKTTTGLLERLKAVEELNRSLEQENQALSNKVSSLLHLKPSEIDSKYSRSGYADGGPKASTVLQGSFAQGRAPSHQKPGDSQARKQAVVSTEASNIPASSVGIPYVLPTSEDRSASRLDAPVKSAMAVPTIAASSHLAPPSKGGAPPSFFSSVKMRALERALEMDDLLRTSGTRSAPPPPVHGGGETDGFFEEGERRLYIQRRAQAMAAAAGASVSSGKVLGASSSGGSWGGKQSFKMLSPPPQSVVYVTHTAG